MPQTPTYSLPYPALTDQPHGPTQIGALASAVDGTILSVYNALVAANAALDAKLSATESKRPRVLPEPAQTGQGSLTAGATLVLASLPIADPGWPYRITAGGSTSWVLAGSVGQPCSVGLEVRVDSNVWSDSVFHSKGVFPVFTNTNFTLPLNAPTRNGTTVYTGNRTLFLIAKNFVNGPAVIGTDGYTFAAAITPA